MIEIKELTKTYCGVPAIDTLSFNVESGSVVGFLGPNGAGKTTTMRILCGYMPPTSGSALIEGASVTDNPDGIKKIVGYLPEDNPLYPDMTPLEYLFFAGRIRGMGEKAIRKRIKETVDICGLGDVTLKPIGALSKGYRQRVGIAQAVLHDPPVMILDEPTSGLDPNQIQEIRDLIRNLRGLKTIILSTHIMQEVQAVCQRVIIINRGVIAADGTQEELTSSDGISVYRVQLDGPDDEVERELKALSQVSSVTREGGVFSVNCRGGDDPRRDIFAAAVRNSWVILRMEKEQRTLEEAFRNLTAGKQ